MNFLVIQLALLLVGVQTIPYRGGWPAQGSYYNSHYVDWYKGSSRTTVIISAPHDGWLRPSSIDNRERGCYNTKTETCDWTCSTTSYKRSTKCNALGTADIWSGKLAMELRDKIAMETGETPHLIINQLHRSKLDPNRERGEATLGDYQAGTAFDTYHGFIKKAHEIVNQYGKPAVHFDIHGYSSHKDLWFELGYLITNSDLDRGYLRASDSSIRSLASRAAKSGISFTSLVRGRDSLGNMFQEAGYKAIPSPAWPSPSRGSHGKYYRGGYTTQTWGSKEGGNIDCIQMEFPPEPRTNNEVHGPQIGKILAAFVNKWYPSY